MNRKEVLEAAEACVCGQREQDYGKPENNFARIGKLWEAYTGHEYSPVDVAIMLALLKVARIASGRFHADNFVDGCGYFALAGELADAGHEPVTAPLRPADPVNCRHNFEPVPADPGNPGPVEPAGDRPAGHSPRRVTFREIKLPDALGQELSAVIVRVLEEAGRKEVKQALGVKPWMSAPSEPVEPAEDEGTEAKSCYPGGCAACPIHASCGNDGKYPAGTTHGEDLARPCPVDPVEAVAKSLAADPDFLGVVQKLGAAVSRALEPVRKVWND